MQGASPLASPRLNPGGAGAGGAILRQAGGRAGRGRFVTGQARTPDCISNSFRKSSWGFGGFFQEAPERFPAMVPGGDGLSRGGARTPDCTSNSFGKSSWGFGGFFQEAPERFPALVRGGDGLSRGGARTPDCTSNSFRKSSWGFGGFFQEAPNVSSFLRIFVSSL